MTGHMVLSTLHTNDAVTTIPRLIDMSIEPYLVASTVNIIIAQRLARMLCEKCKESYEVTSEELKNLVEVRPDIAKEIKLHQKIFRHKGCKECGNTGYKGRIGLYEILEVTKSMREMISNQNFNVDDLYDESKKWGLVRIFDDGIDKMNEGLLDIPELIRVIALTE
jgi:type IV pilus assembly protein PilB